MGRLFWKFFIAFWLALLLTAGLAGSLVWLSHAQENETHADPFTREQLTIVASILRTAGGDSLRQMLPSWTHRGRPTPIFVVDAHGQELMNRPLPPEKLAQARRLADLNQPESAARWLPTRDGETYLVFVHATDAHRPPFDGIFSLGGRHQPPSAPPPYRPHVPWRHIVAGLLVSLGFSVVLAWYVVSPIRQLRQAVKSVAAGQLDTRVSPRMGRRRDELGELGQDFDAMTQQLETLIGAQRRLLHDVSHELRSPLARLHVAIGLIAQTPDKLPTMLTRLEREIGRLDTLVGEVLTLARLESGMPHAPAEAFDGVALLEDLLADAQFEAEAQGLSLCYQGATEAPLHGQPALLARAFENVIRNAIKYSPAHGVVTIESHLDRHCRSWVVSVSDTGDGVPEDTLPLIFRAFYRGSPPPPRPDAPPSPSASNPAGYGLGLAIAERALATHGGTMHAKNRPEGGLVVVMRVPLAGR